MFAENIRVVIFGINVHTTEQYSLTVKGQYSGRSFTRMFIVVCCVNDCSCRRMLMLTNNLNKRVEITSKLPVFTQAVA